MAITGFIGLGIMGRGMASRLARSRTQDQVLLVYNRTRSVAESFAKEINRAGVANVQVAASAKDVVMAASVTYSMLSTPEACDSVFNCDSGVLAGLKAVPSTEPAKVLVDAATVTADQMRRMANATEQAGHMFLEAPVSGSKVPAEQGQLIFLCAGHKEVFKRVRPDLEGDGAMGKRAFHLGEVGAGSEMKLAINGMMGTLLASYAEAATLVEASGLNEQDFASIVSLGAMASPMFSLKASAIQDRKFTAADAHFPLKHALKDLRLAQALSIEKSSPVPLIEAAEALYAKANNAGFGDADFSAIAAMSSKDEGGSLYRMGARSSSVQAQQEKHKAAVAAEASCINANMKLMKKSEPQWRRCE